MTNHRHMANSDRVITALNEIDATTDERLGAVILLGSNGRHAALEYCAMLKIMRSVPEYEFSGYAVDATELL
jgi:hypothetical protein